MEIQGTKTLRRLERLREAMKLPGRVRGEVICGKVYYFIGSQPLGNSAPRARSRLRAMGAGSAQANAQAMVA